VLTTLVSPLTGQPLGEEEKPLVANIDHGAAAAALDDRLSKVERPEPELDAVKPGEEDQRR
jgi:hypothetical protein